MVGMMAAKSRGGYLEVSRYSFEDAMRYLSALAAHHRGGHAAPSRPFEEGGAIERREVRTEAGFVPSARGFADVLKAIDTLGICSLEWWVVLGVWRDGGRVQDVARRLEKRDATVWAAFYSGTEAVLYELTREPGMKHQFQVWRERRHMKRMSDGPT